MRVADVGQGSNALRVTSICSLPDGSGVDALEGVEEDARKQLQRQHVVSALITPFVTCNEYCNAKNVELSFAYRALPSGMTAQSKAQNAQ